MDEYDPDYYKDEIGVFDQFLMDHEAAMNEAAWPWTQDIGGES